MKRKAGWIGLLGMTLLLGWFWQPVAAQFKYAALSFAQTFTALQTFSGGVKTPLKVGTDYTLTNPAVAPTGATSATSGSCTTGANSPYRFYTAWANLSGITNISPASTDVAGTFLKRAVVTRSESVPSGATGWLVYWSGSSDGHAAKKLCLSGSADSLLVASGTSTYDCSCSGSGAGHGGTNQTGLVAATSINVLGNNILGFGNVGSTIGSVTADNRRLDLSGSIPKWSSDSGASYADIPIKYSQVVTICPTAGVCDYTTLNAACVGRTSTAANPIMYMMGPGLYQPGATQSCSGEDSLAIVGAGPGATVIDVVAVGNGFALDLGTSKNVYVSNLSLKGVRAVNWPLSGTGGGISWFVNVDFYSDDTTGTNGDCLLYGAIGAGGAAAGSELHLIGNRCGYTTDGFSILDDANTAVYTSDNTFYISAAPDTSRSSAWSLFSIPCVFEASDETMNLDTTPSVAHTGSDVGLNGYLFEGGQTNSCVTPTSLSIRDARVYINDKTANGTNADATAIRVGTTATEAASILVSGALINVNVPNDSGNGNARGIDINNSTSVVAVYGTRIRTTGGQVGTRLDLDGNVVGSILVGPESDWLTDDGNLTGDRSRNPRASKPASCVLGDKYMDTSGAYCVCTATGTPGTWTNVTAVGTCV